MIKFVIRITLNTYLWLCGDLNLLNLISNDLQKKVWKYKQNKHY